jgi:hypothetical protein
MGASTAMQIEIEIIDSVRECLMHLPVYATIFSVVHFAFVVKRLTPAAAVLYNDGARSDYGCCHE